MMDEVFSSVEGVRISVSGVIIYAKTMAELVKRIRKVFDGCREYSLKLNHNKCEFGVKQITVLGHIVSEKGVKPDVANMEAVKATPLPENVSYLRSFLGTCGW